MRWFDETSPSCEACRKIYAEKAPPEEAPCGSCKPVVDPENEDAVNAYLLTRNQVVMMGMETVADINIVAVKIVMDLFGVKDQRACLLKVRHLFHEFKPRREKV